MVAAPVGIRRKAAELLKKVVGRISAVSYFGPMLPRFVTPLLLILPFSLLSQHLDADGHTGSQEVAAHRTIATDIAPVEYNYIGRRAEHRQKGFFGLYGGWSTMNAGGRRGVSDAMRKHERHLRQGMHLGAQATWFNPRGIGLGAKAHYFQSTASTDMSRTDPVTGQVYALEKTDDVSITFIGPTLSGRLYSANERLLFIFDLSAGRLFYRNHAVMGDAVTIKGNTLGISYGFNADIMVSERISLGVGVAHCFGTLKVITRDDGETETLLPLRGMDRPPLSRLDLSARIHWHW